MQTPHFALRSDQLATTYHFELSVGRVARLGLYRDQDSGKNWVSIHFLTLFENTQPAFCRFF